MRMSLAPAETDVLEVRNLKKYFPLQEKGLLRRTIGTIKAVDDVSFTVRKGETVGVIGESGCGKTTLGRCVAYLYEKTAGDIIVRGGGQVFRLDQLNRGNNSEFRKIVQVIFQDPFSSLNPRMSVLRSVGEPLLVNGLARGVELEERVADIIQRVGLSVSHLQRFPHSFSGGQRQRICIARALVINPQLVVADEPVSALDVSIQAQMLNLLKDLQQDFELSYLFISHSMSVIRYMSDRILVMYAGKIIESGSRDENPAAAAAPVHRNAAQGCAQGQQAQEPASARRHQRRTARSAQSALRLRLSSALSFRQRHLSRRNPAVADRQRRPAGQLPSGRRIDLAGSIRLGEAP